MSDVFCINVRKSKKGRITFPWRLVLLLCGGEYFDIYLGTLIGIIQYPLIQKYVTSAKVRRNTCLTRFRFALSSPAHSPTHRISSSVGNLFFVNDGGQSACRLYITKQLKQLTAAILMKNN